jgi:hypothetical protein
MEQIMNDTTITGAGAVASVADTISSASGADTLSSAQATSSTIAGAGAVETDQKTVEGAHAGMIDAEQGVEETVGTELDAFKAYLAKSDAATLLADIEKSVRYLAKMIEAIPDGIAHGWHSLAAEIKSRI